jgi:hypothetical protein
MTRGDKWTIAGVLIGALALVVAVIVALWGDELACRGRQDGSCKGSANPTTSPNGPAISESPQVPTAAPPSTVRSPQVVELRRGNMTLYPPVCTTHGIDLDALQEVDSPPDAEFIYRNESCQQGRGQAFMSALEGVPLTHISSSRGPVPTFAQCVAGLRDRPSTTIEGLGPSGGTLCFETTAGHIAGVALTSSTNQVVQLQVALWDFR